MKKLYRVYLLAFTILYFSVQQSIASSYIIDTEGGHAFIQFRISHLGYSWLVGRFNRFSGEFVYDKNDPSAASVNVLVETASIDSNHAERDKHLRDDDFLDVKQFPEARFVSRSYIEREDGSGLLTGDLTLRGVTRSIDIEVAHVGAGIDPWGGYRRGFTGRTKLVLADFGITKYLGDAAKEMELILGIEGIRTKSKSGSRKPR